MYEELVACHAIIKEFAMTEPIDAIFAACVLILQVIGEWIHTEPGAKVVCL